MHEVDDGKWSTRTSFGLFLFGTRPKRMLCGKQEHMVTARQRVLIRSSWDLMRPMAIHVADLFYDRLFELDPSLEALFPEDLTSQRPRFMNAVGAAVAGLDDMDALRHTLLDVGRQNLSQGVLPGHYDTLGKALLWAFEQSLAEEFTPLVKEAWAALHAEALHVEALQVEEALHVDGPRATRDGGELREGAPARERIQLAL
jgi:hemoglobin-like flavoprotein